MSTTRRRSLNRGASCYKHIFAAIVGERLPRRTHRQCIDLQTRDIDKAEPLVLGRPPQAGGGSVFTPGARRAAARSKTARRSAHVARCSSARNGHYTTAKPLPAVKMRMASSCPRP